MKSDLVQAIRCQLEQRLQRVMQAARDSHRAATDPDSKAESKYDTRNLEASYLASGQARQAEQLSHALRMFDRLPLPSYGDADVIGPGALVRLTQAGEDSWYLLVPAAGGLEVEEGGRTITLLSPESPLYQGLLGLSVGQPIERPRGRVTGLA